ncbi:hypothetical protein Q9295_06295 [Xinfangfangia sp. CPCC 101601]|uniref:Nuclear transport factor 2 family protein n=1 Tax=Pseudogemmobacter lacusdianii TaxID=3069608 RepID=A0ABU0VW94_9RHOB|nr:hypothetical protein [Xinfangfangia sp. CPCC 101601]MDQ2065973.1 hypothetical protein [Xinfangfangia sp. CPCC 101601]
MSLQASIATIAVHFSLGQYDQLAARYTYPLPLYLNDEPQVFATPQAFQSFLERLHKQLTGDGLQQLEGNLVSVELTRCQRFRVWADWTIRGANGHQTVMQSISFNSGSHKERRTEMIQFVVTPAIAAKVELNAA